MLFYFLHQPSLRQCWLHEAHLQKAKHKLATEGQITETWNSGGFTVIDDAAIPPRAHKVLKTIAWLLSTSAGGRSRAADGSAIDREA